MKASYYWNNCQQIEIKSKLAQEFYTTVDAKILKAEVEVN